MTDQAVKRRVASRHGPANEVIDGLRTALAEAANAIAKLGDSVVEAKDDAEAAMQNEHDAKAEAENAVRDLVAWRELLEDYRRGIRDREELLEGTIGHG